MNRWIKRGIRVNRCRKLCGIDLGNCFHVETLEIQSHSKHWSRIMYCDHVGQVTLQTQLKNRDQQITSDTPQQLHIQIYYLINQI